jgi:hypothetical protein
LGARGSSIGQAFDQFLPGRMQGFFFFGEVEADVAVLGLEEECQVSWMKACLV